MADIKLFRIAGAEVVEVPGNLHLTEKRVAEAFNLVARSVNMRYTITVRLFGDVVTGLAFGI